MTMIADLFIGLMRTMTVVLLATAVIVQREGAPSAWWLWLILIGLGVVVFMPARREGL